MSTRHKDGRCKKGHEMTEANTIMRAGGYKGRKYPNCKKCYNKRTSKYECGRYNNDAAFREKKKAKVLAYKLRKKLERVGLITTTKG